MGNNIIDNSLKSCIFVEIDGLWSTGDIEVVLKPLLEIPSLIRTGVITHALVTAAFYRYDMEYADSRR
jgi:hypothetical protein